MFTVILHQRILCTSDYLLDHVGCVQVNVKKHITSISNTFASVSYPLPPVYVLENSDAVTGE